MSIGMGQALKQYIDLAKGHRSLLDSHSCSMLNACRDRAFDVLESTQLPKLGAEDYRLTDLNGILEPDYGLNLDRVSIDVNPAESFHCDVPAVSTALFFLINDTFTAATNARNLLPEGVILESMAHPSERGREIIERYYGSIADINNPTVALNTLLAQDGVLLHIDKGVKLTRPLQLVNILQNGAPLMAVRRLLIHLEDDVQAQMLICDHTQNPEVDYLNLQTIEVVLDKGASLDLYDLEESTLRTHRLSTFYSRQATGSQLLVDAITLYNGFTRNEYRCAIEGEEASLQLLGMGIEDKNRVLDTYSFIDHACPHGRSNEMFKYVADDEARCNFAGRILVRPGAHHTDSYQSNRNILGSAKARIYSKPQLEIYNDDVKCSHGSAIGQLDEMQLFYMRTRGVDEQDARLLLKQAFMADIIEAVRMPGLKERLRVLVEHRFSGRDSSCADCRGKCNTEIERL